MVFAHDTRDALRAAVALANSALEPDTLDSLDALSDFFDDFDYTGRLDADRDELDQARAIRPELDALLTAGRDDAVRRINQILSRQNAVPQLVRRGGLDWHIHAVADDAPLATRILVETAMAMIDVVRSDELDRLGRCADEACSGIVLDLSRNRSRLYCSTACGNRNAVAAYRARLSREEQDASS
ncbi:MAG TPA: CGNR zinc finger domain-containing protein [Aeromicrobium sp.]|nr:CGNR zinc finger domain-containing protein [Aeromicrobium sp.]